MRAAWGAKRWSLDDMPLMRLREVELSFPEADAVPVLRASAQAPAGIQIGATSQPSDELQFIFGEPPSDAVLPGAQLFSSVVSGGTLGLAGGDRFGILFSDDMESALVVEVATKRLIGPAELASLGGIDMGVVEQLRAGLQPTEDLSNQDPLFI